MSAPSAAAVSDQLRNGRSPSLTRRRYIVGASLFCCGTMSLAALYQTGVIRRVPDVSIRRFDSNQVMSSPQAYEILGMPDAPLAVGSYAATAGLAAIAGADRNRRQPLLALLLTGKVIIDSAFALKLVRDQFVRQHRTFCEWCLSTSAVTISMLIPAFLEFLDASKSRKDVPS